MTVAKTSEQLQSDLIGRVYEAALDDSLWRGVASRIAEAFDGTSSVLFVSRAGEGTAQFLDRTANFDDSVVAAYESHYFGTDVWVERGMPLGLRNVYLSRDLITDREFEHTEYYGDWCRKANVHYMMGTGFDTGNGTIAFLGIHRVKALGEYDEASRERAQAFSVHLERALRIRNRLAQAGFERELGLEALQHAQMAVLAVDAQGRVAFANARAAALSQADSPLRVRDGRLWAAGAANQNRLAALVADAAAHAGGELASAAGAMAFARAGRFPLAVTVIPLRAPTSALARPMALVMVRDPEDADLPLDMLKGLFGFTTTEAVVARHLAGGMSVADIAQWQGVSEATVRTQVNKLLTKTQTNRQQELISLILRSTVPAARPH